MFAFHSSRVGRPRDENSIEASGTYNAGSGHKNVLAARTWE
jgi:hypothetical protein